MTRGNQRNIDRERAQKRNKQAASASDLKKKDKAMNVICQICRQPFMCTVDKRQLEIHQQEKHPKSTFAECFPDRNPV